MKFDRKALKKENRDTLRRALRGRIARELLSRLVAAGDYMGWRVVNIVSVVIFFAATCSLGAKSAPIRSQCDVGAFFVEASANLRAAEMTQITNLNDYKKHQAYLNRGHKAVLALDNDLGLHCPSALGDDELSRFPPIEELLSAWVGADSADETLYFARQADCTYYWKAVGRAAIAFSWLELAQLQSNTARSFADLRPSIGSESTLVSHVTNLVMQKAALLDVKLPPISDISRVRKLSDSLPSAVDTATANLPPVCTRNISSK